MIFGHSDGYEDIEGLRVLAEAGCYIQLDVFGWEDTSIDLLFPGEVGFTNDSERLRSMATVAEMGFIDKLLVSQDVCQPWQYVQKGGKGFGGKGLHWLDEWGESRLCNLKEVQNKYEEQKQKVV